MVVICCFTSSANIILWMSPFDLLTLSMTSKENECRLNVVCCFKFCIIKAESENWSPFSCVWFEQLPWRTDSEYENVYLIVLWFNFLPLWQKNSHRNRILNDILHQNTLQKSPLAFILSTFLSQCLFTKSYSPLLGVKIQNKLNYFISHLISFCWVGWKYILIKQTLLIWIIIDFFHLCPVISIQ